MFILWLTGVAFIATEGVLFWFLWKYNATDNRQPVKFSHGSHTLEVVWTILPAATLLFIAIYQMNAWAESKMRVPKRPIRTWSSAGSTAPKQFQSRHVIPACMAASSVSRANCSR